MAYAQLETQESAGIAGEVQAEGKGGVMHLADIEGRIYQRRKQRKRELQFAAAWCGILLGIAAAALAYLYWRPIP